MPSALRNKQKDLSYVNENTANNPYTRNVLLFRMDRPSKITFLDSDGTTAFEFRIPTGQSDMVRHPINSKSSPLPSASVVFIM